MAGMNVKLNGRAIKKGYTMEIERYNITDAKRVASGDMKIQLIAKKRKFLLSYAVLSGAEFDSILQEIDSNNMLINMTYTENGVNKSAVVYCGPIKGRYHRSDMGWYWKDVTFNLIER